MTSRVVWLLGIAAVLFSACTTTPPLAREEATGAETAEAATSLGAPDGSSDAEALRAARERTANAETMRFAISVEQQSSLSLGDRTSPFLVGELVGNRSYRQMDMSVFLGASIAGSDLSASSLAMTVMTSEGDLYFNSPFYGQLAEQGVARFGDDPSWVAEIATQWGWVNTQVLDREFDALSLVGLSSGGDVDDLLALLDADGELLAGGTGEVGGDATTVTHVSMPLRTLLGASGRNLSHLGVAPDDWNLVGEVPANLEVHIDENDMVRRLEFTMDLGGFSAVAEEPVSIWQRVDLSDFNEQISIKTPLGSVDVTDEVLALTRADR